MKITNIITMCLLATSAIAMDFTNPGNKPNKNRTPTAHAAPRLTAVQQREEEFRAEYNAFMQETRNGTITATPQMYLKYFNKMYEDTFNEEINEIKKTCNDIRLRLINSPSRENIQKAFRLELVQQQEIEETTHNYRCKKANIFLTVFPEAATPGIAQNTYLLLKAEQDFYEQNHLSFKVLDREAKIIAHEIVTKSNASTSGNLDRIMMHNHQQAMQRQGEIMVSNQNALLRQIGHR